MERLTQLLADLKGLDEKLDALLANDTLSDEESAEHDRLVAERDKNVKLISAERARLEREQERTRLEAEAAETQAKREAAAALAEEKAKRLREASTGRKTEADLPVKKDVPGERVQTAPRITIPASVRRVSLKNFKGVRNGMSADERAYACGMYMMAKMHRDLPSRFPHLKGAEEWCRRHLSAVSEADGTGYQYLVQEEFGQDIIDLRETYGVARQVLRAVPMISDTRTDPRRRAGLTAYFTAEGSAGTESNKTWSQVRLTAKDLMVLSRYTAQVNADAVLNIGDDLAGEIAYAFSNKEDDCCFNGDGTSTYGGIQGFRTALTGLAGRLNAATTGAWSSIALSDFNLLIGKLPQYADMTGEVWWVTHRAFYFGVMQRLELAAGGVTQMSIQEGQTRPVPLFLGYPVKFSQIMPSVTAATGVMALFGNFMLSASFGDRQQDTVAFSEHASVGGESVFERNEIAIRGTERFDIVVHDVGDSSTPGPVVGLATG